MWDVHCERCSFVARERFWQRALWEALEHARRRDHWGGVVVRRLEDDGEYVLKAWGLERRKGEIKKIA